MSKGSQPTFESHRPAILKIGAILFAAILLMANASMAQTDSNAGTWSGVIINSGCTADEAFAEAPKCTENVAGTKLVLYDDTTRQMFDLDPQTRASGLLGNSVTVHGKLDGATIHVSSLDKLTSFGLNVGQKAPPFSLTDQFGHTQTLQTLKGAHGTILLFFRSADW
jgi:hypothetical protein